MTRINLLLCLYYYIQYSCLPHSHFQVSRHAVKLKEVFQRIVSAFVVHLHKLEVHFDFLITKIFEREPVLLRSVLSFNSNREHIEPTIHF
jgi:hypothetical protein